MSFRFFSGNKKYKIFFFVLLGLVAMVGLSILFGFLVRFLWNETIAIMFGVTTITFWQALGLFILAKLFFGFGVGGGSGHSGHRKRGKRKHGKSDAAPADDDAFRQFWQTEGKAAYEAYREQRDTGSRDKDEP